MHWTHQAPLCIGFPRQKYWSVLPHLLPEDPEIWILDLQVASKPLSHQGSPVYQNISIEKKIENNLKSSPLGEWSRWHIDKWDIMQELNVSKGFSNMGNACYLRLSWKLENTAYIFFSF